MMNTEIGTRLNVVPAVIPSAKYSATLLYTDQIGAEKGLHLLFNSLDKAALSSQFNLAVLNLNTLEATDTLDSATDHIRRSSIIIFAVDNLPSPAVQDWIDRWLHSAGVRGLVVYAPFAAISDDDHALICSYFRAVAFHSGRNFLCGSCSDFTVSVQAESNRLEFSWDEEGFEPDFTSAYRSNSQIALVANLI